MKKRTFIYLFALCGGSLIISGYYTGVAVSFGLDATGAETSLGREGCSLTGACHAHTPSQAWINVDIELDSAGIPTTHYIGGQAYTVKLKGLNTTNDSLPAFGFQITSIAGDTSAPVPLNAGTWTTPFPANTHYAAPEPGNFDLGLMEQNPPHPVTTGDGRLGSTYVVAFNWTAPPSGTGTISFWGVINAVNNDGTLVGDNYNNHHVVINEWLPLGINALETIPDFNLSLFPNPAVDHVNLTYMFKKNE